MLTHGATVIFNEEYIDEIIRHRDIAKRKYEVENMPKEKEKCKQSLDAWEQKLEWAESFQDSIDHIKHLDIPNLTVVRTMGGYAYPAKYLQVI